MICVLIDVIPSVPDRPVRLEVQGSDASLGKRSHNFKKNMVSPADGDVAPE